MKIIILDVHSGFIMGLIEDFNTFIKIFINKHSFDSFKVQY